MTYPLATPPSLPSSLTVPRGARVDIAVHRFQVQRSTRATSISRSRYRVVVIPPPSSPSHPLFSFVSLFLESTATTLSIHLSRALFSRCFSSDNTIAIFVSSESTESSRDREGFATRTNTPRIRLSLAIPKKRKTMHFSISCFRLGNGVVSDQISVAIRYIDRCPLSVINV